MKYSIVALAAAGLVAAQDFSGQPKCAIPCLEKALPKVDCTLEDTACACKPETQAKLVAIVGPCLITECSATDLAKAQAAAAAACANNGASSSVSASSSGSSSEAVSTTSGAATSTAGGVTIQTSTPSGMPTHSSNGTTTHGTGSTFNPTSSIEESTTGTETTGGPRTTSSDNMAAGATVGVMAAVLAVVAAL